MFVKGPNNQTLWQPKASVKENPKTTPEPDTGYMDHAQGEKHCFNCEHFVKSENGCDGPKMIQLSLRPTLPNGDVKVHPIGVCDFWEAAKK